MGSKRFGSELRKERQKAGLTLRELAQAVGRTASGIFAIEVGRVGVEQSPELVRELESALHLRPGRLAQFLPEDHPARRISEAEVPVLRLPPTVSEGSPVVADETGEVLRLSSLFLGCVAYRGLPLFGGDFQDRDFVIVRPEVRLKKGHTVLALIGGSYCLLGSHDLGKIKNPVQVFGQAVAVVRLF